MRNENAMRRPLLLSAIVALLLIGLMFDLIINSLQVRNTQGAGLEPVLIVLFSLFELALMLCGMGVFWYMVVSGESSALVSWAFLIAGFFILFGTPLLYFLPVPMNMLAVVPYIQPGTYAFQMGGVLAVIGILSMFVKPVAPAEAVVAAPAAEPVEREL